MTIDIRDKKLFPCPTCLEVIQENLQALERRAKRKAERADKEIEDLDYIEIETDDLYGLPLELDEEEDEEHQS